MRGGYLPFFSFLSNIALILCTANLEPASATLSSGLWQVITWHTLTGDMSVTSNSPTTYTVAAAAAAADDDNDDDVVGYGGLRK